MAVDTELRANWVAHESIITAEGRSSIIRTMADARLNTVFVSMPPISGNYGEGKVEAFFAFLKDAKSKGFVVFGWISNHKRTYPVPADLRLPEEREAQAKWVEDIIVDFPCLDGIAIDYIRYPTWEISDFEKQQGVTLTVKAIREVTDKAGVTLLSTSFPAATVSYRGVQSQWEGAVPDWFQEWYTTNPNNYYQLEASTGGTGIVNQDNVGGSKPQYLLGPSFMSYQQDPVTWIENGFVDHLVPMQYTSDPAVMRNEIDRWEEFTSLIGHPMTGIYLGLGWFDEPSSFPDSQFDAAAMVAHINYGREKGVGGYTIFRMGIPGIDDTPLVEALTTPNNDNSRTPPFSTNKASPFPRSDSTMCEKILVFTSSGERNTSLDSASCLASTMVLLVLLRGIYRARMFRFYDRGWPLCASHDA